MPSSVLAKIKSAPKAQIITTVLAVVLCVWAAQARPAQPILQLGTATYAIAIADDEPERHRGLSGYTALAPNEAMLFVFEQSDRHCFWMKDMALTIDMIWLDSQRQVVHVQPRVAPDTYPQAFCPPVPARYVVEVAAGQAAAAGIKQGSRATF